MKKAPTIAKRILKGKTSVTIVVNIDKNKIIRNKLNSKLFFCLKTLINRITENNKKIIETKIP